MKYRSKPVVADLVVFSREATPHLTASYPGLVLTIHEDGPASVLNELHGSAIRLEEGDFINVTTPGDYYPIKAEVVATRYELADVEAGAEA